MPDGFRASDWACSRCSEAVLRLDARVTPGLYAKQGTGIVVRLVVFDKLVAAAPPVIVEAATLCDNRTSRRAAGATGDETSNDAVSSPALALPPRCHPAADAKSVPRRDDAGASSRPDRHVDPRPARGRRGSDRASICPGGPVGSSFRARANIRPRLSSPSRWTRLPRQSRAMCPTCPARLFPRGCFRSHSSKRSSTLEKRSSATCRGFRAR